MAGQKESLVFFLVLSSNFLCAGWFLELSRMRWDDTALPMFL